MQKVIQEMEWELDKNKFVYKYREVICPWCDHRFMWNRTGNEFPLHRIRLKETGESLDDTECPKCGSEVVVLDHVMEGLDVDDARIEVAGWGRP